MLKRELVLEQLEQGLWGLLRAARVKLMFDLTVLFCSKSRFSIWRHTRIPEVMLEPPGKCVTRVGGPDPASAEAIGGCGWGDQVGCHSGRACPWQPGVLQSGRGLRAHNNS